MMRTSQLLLDLVGGVIGAALTLYVAGQILGVL